MPPPKQPLDESKGEWRCKCTPNFNFDKSVNPSCVSSCLLCGAHRPGKDYTLVSEVRPIFSGAWIGPCIHGRDPYDRCDACGELTPQQAKAVAEAEDFRGSDKATFECFSLDDSGVIFTWEKSGAELSVVIPKDRIVVFYVGKKHGERHAGVMSDWGSLELMLKWLEDGTPFPTDGVTEGRDVY